MKCYLFVKILILITILLISFDCTHKQKDKEVINVYDSEYDIKPMKEHFTGEYEGLYKEDKIKYRGNYINGLKDGQFITYYLSGKIKRIENYYNDTLQGQSSFFPFEDESHKIRTFFNKGTMIEQIVYDTLLGDTFSYYKQHISHTFKKRKIIRIINSKDTNNIKVLEFRNDTVISNKTPVNFLTNEDSIIILKSYSNWKKMPVIVRKD